MLQGWIEEEELAKGTEKTTIKIKEIPEMCDVLKVKQDSMPNK